MRNKLHLYWLENNWQKRGYAMNYNLVVDLGEKTFRTFTNSFYGYENPEDIEVKRKIDIVNYVGYLKLCGFREEKA